MAAVRAVALAAVAAAAVKVAAAVAAVVAAMAVRVAAAMAAMAKAIAVAAVRVVRVARAAKVALPARVAPARVAPVVAAPVAVPLLLLEALLRQEWASASVIPAARVVPQVVPLRLVPTPETSAIHRRLRMALGALAAFLLLPSALPQTCHPQLSRVLSPERA